LDSPEIGSLVTANEEENNPIMRKGTLITSAKYYSPNRRYILDYYSNSDPTSDLTYHPVTNFIQNSTTLEQSELIFTKISLPSTSSSGSCKGKKVDPKIRQGRKPRPSLMTKWSKEIGVGRFGASAPSQ
jgi:hypothetical protein